MLSSFRYDLFLFFSYPFFQFFSSSPLLNSPLLLSLSCLSPLSSLLFAHLLSYFSLLLSFSALLLFISSAIYSSFAHLSFSFPLFNYSTHILLWSPFHFLFSFCSIISVLSLSCSSYPLTSISLFSLPKSFCKLMHWTSYDTFSRSSRTNCNFIKK